jgi:hypothetical protein
MLCPCQGREKVNFLTSREASWRSRLSANGEGGEVGTNFSHHSSITVQFPLTLLPAYSPHSPCSLRPKTLCRAPPFPAGREIILQQPTGLFPWIRDSYASALTYHKHLKYHPSITCKLPLSFYPELSCSHVLSLPSFLKVTFSVMWNIAVEKSEKVQIHFKLVF